MSGIPGLRAKAAPAGAPTTYSLRFTFTYPVRKSAEEAESLELLYATSREVAARIASKPIALLPLAGFYEPDGAWPLGAWLALARYAANVFAVEADALVMPAIPFSSVPGAEPKAGEIAIPYDAFRKYLEAVLDEARSNDLRPVIISTAPSGDGMSYIVTREYFERTGFPLLWVDLVGLIRRTDVPYLPAGEAKMPAVLAAALEAGARQAAAGRRFLQQLAGSFAAEVPPALSAYAKYLAEREDSAKGWPPFRRPVKGFPIWAG